MNELALSRPEDGVLSEEGSPNPVHPSRHTSRRVWIVDPLDGTREFGEPPRDDWAVHVALAVDGFPIVGADFCAKLLAKIYERKNLVHGLSDSTFGDRTRASNI